jgi:anthranilate phosphoribosyltransferase
MKNILQKLTDNHTLSKEEAHQALLLITQGNISPIQIAAFMTVYMMRAITVDELEGFRDAMLEQCIAIDLSDYQAIDLCGTGGDGKDTFNISTLSAFVVAGAGIKVAKHGNYGVSSAVGSSNILEFFGIKFSNDIGLLKNQLERAGICLLHAPLFHPAMKNVAPVRKEMGVKTFFNMLGPMVNPSKPSNQMVGVYSLELARLYAYVFQKTDKNFTIVHSLDGYDEISLTSAVKILWRAERDFEIEKGYEHFKSMNGNQNLSPEELGFTKLKPHEIASGENIDAAASIFMNVLENKSTLAQKNVVVVNAAKAIQTALPKKSWDEALHKATASIESGKALQSFKIIASN